MKNTTKTALALAISAAFASSPLANAATADFDISGTESWDDLGSANNTVLTFDLAAELGLASGTSVTITGVGWDLVLDSIGASWGADMTLAIGSSTNPPELFLTPSGTQDPVMGEVNTSGGILDLTDNGVEDIILSDGLVVLEFFESYDDVVDAVDGVWTSGILSFEGSMTPVPLPAAFPLLLTGLAGLFAARRRRAS